MTQQFGTRKAAQKYFNELVRQLDNEEWQINKSHAIHQDEVSELVITRIDKEL